jgi:hypothetical protein
MTLAFSGQARYPDFTDGYELYVRRARKNEPVDIQTYTKVVKDYCKMLAECMESEGMVDLPSGLGSIAPVYMKRKAKYRKKKFIGYGKWDWKYQRYDGSPIAFGITFLPNQDKNSNLRCYGFVANRQLFKRMKKKYDEGTNPWYTMEFNDKMI